MLRLGWVVVIVGVLGSVAGRADACDCLQAEPAPREALGKAAAVFEGRALTRQGDRTELLVERAWKGAVAGERVVVASDGSSCGYRFVPGDRVLIYAPRVAGTLHVAQCDGTQATRVVMGEGIEADRAVLGAPTSAAATSEPAACACTGLALAASAANTVEALEARVLRTRVSAGRRQIDVERTSRGPRSRPRAWTLHTPADACGVGADLAAGARVRIRGAIQWPGALAIGACVPGSSMTVLGARPPAR